MNGRDTQRLKFYNWSRYRNQQLKYPIDSVEEVITNFVSGRGVKVPKFRYSGKKYRYSPSKSEITLPLNRAMTLNLTDICRLIGWHFVCETSPKGEGWHGPYFCLMFAIAEAEITGCDVQDIISSMHTDKLKVSGQVSNAPSALSLKKYAKAYNRVEELEAAISRGREEFEQFLQPIIKELETARQTLEKIDTKNS